MTGRLLTLETAGRQCAAPEHYGRLRVRPGKTGMGANRRLFSELAILPYSESCWRHLKTYGDYGCVLGIAAHDLWRSS
jgi:hypothetical protein